MTSKTNSNGNSFKPYKSYLFLGLSILVLMAVATFVYSNLKQIFLVSLQEQVRAITQTAVLNFDPETLDQITGPESIKSDTYRKTVLALQELKLQNPSLRFVDIYRRTDQPHLFEYVADSNSLNPDIPTDDNGDGVIDEMDEQIYPGEIYDGSVAPSFVENAFIKSDVSSTLEASQWGLTLDASSPIFYKNGESDYVLNVSVDVTEFIRQTDLSFIPFSIFVFIVIVILVLLTLSLIRLWKSRVTFFTELDRQKDELLGLVSHQLATPVSSIKWYLEMLKDGDLGPLNKDQTEHVAAMHGIGESMSDLVSMILDVSRIQLGRMRIEKQELDLNTFFHDLLATIEPKAIEKKVELVKNIPKDMPVAMLDRRYTNMTIENLLSNAVKYTPTGGKVTCDVKIEKNEIFVTVSDTGMGIPKAEQDKIFGRMFRASNARNAIDGNGFGLFVAKGAVEAQGGKIWFESTEGKGTTFYVRLPVKD